MKNIDLRILKNNELIKIAEEEISNIDLVNNEFYVTINTQQGKSIMNKYFPNGKLIFEVGACFTNEHYGKWREVFQLRAELINQVLNCGDEVNYFFSVLKSAEEIEDIDSFEDDEIEMMYDDISYARDKLEEVDSELAKIEEIIYEMLNIDCNEM